MTSSPPDATPRRIDGLDVARAVAILGMFGAHIGDDGTRAPDTEGWAWLAITHGFPSALFAVLAGVSMTLMFTARGTVAPRDVTAADATRARVRIATRGAILIPLGAALTALDTFVAVILTSLGVMFILTLPLLRLSTRTLAIVAGVLAVTGAWIARTLESAAWAVGLGDVPLLDTVWAEHYPVPVWMAYVLVGVVVGRLPLRADAVAGYLAALGLGVGLLARGAGQLLEAAATGADAWVSTDAHSYSPIEIVQNTGVALAVIGASLWAARRIPRALWPLRATGSMALTLYTAHILVIAAVGNAIITDPSNVAYVALALGAIAFACAWRAWQRQGPLEWAMSTAADAAADAWRDRATRRAGAR